MDYGLYVQQDTPLTNLNSGTQGNTNLSANNPASPSVSPFIPDSTFFDVLRIYRSSIERTAIMYSSSQQSMKWIYYGIMLLNILALWVIYMFSTATLSLFGYFITSPAPGPMDSSDFFTACVLGALILSPPWLLLIWVIWKATVPLDAVSTRIRKMCHVVVFQLFFFAVVVATMTANVIIGVIVKGGDKDLDAIHLAQAGVTGAGLMCFSGLFIVLLTSFALLLIKQCTRR